MVQVSYNSSESVTRGAKGRISCQMIWGTDTDQSSSSEPLI